MRDLRKEYELVKKEYAKIGVDTDKAIERLSNVRISMHCWQGDDVRGFLFNSDLSGGIQTTGNYPGRARNVKELKEDIVEVLKLVPGKFNLNLHAIYADTNEKIDLDQIEPKHFASWVNFAKEHNLGLDFNPTCFSHKMASTGFTLSSPDENVRNFWIEHCKRSSKIGEYFGKELGIPCVTNIWIPDGMKDIPYDRLSPRIRLKDSLDKILEEKIDPKYNIDSVESKVFGIGVESYTVGSNEFYLGYATKNQTCLTLDAGHFHPTEYISDKISSVLLYVPHLLLHVSRPVRWDSDHVVIFDDELNEIARSLVRSNLIEKTSIGLDYFDASINRIAAWVVGIRSTQKALLKAMLEPVNTINELEKEMKYTERMVLTEEMKTMPFGVVYDYYCFINNIPVGQEYLNEVKNYEKNVLLGRK
ncbi:MAG TPA: L-rhamnose isomerase [Firmicutes bacterium]|nr:L-rhamnose isomerase [Bacillota bacterium]